jgi:hypothetical protein
VAVWKHGLSLDGWGGEPRCRLHEAPSPGASTGSSRAQTGPARTPWGTLGARPPGPATRGPNPRTRQMRSEVGLRGESGRQLFARFRCGR